MEPAYLTEVNYVMVIILFIGGLFSYGTVLVTAIKSKKVRQLQVTLLWTGTELQPVTHETGSTDLKELPREK